MNFFRHHTVFFIVVLVLTACCPVRAQHAFKKLTADDYARWGTLRVNQIADDGKWSSFSMGYESGADTLFLRHIQHDRKYVIAAARDGKFIGNDHYAYTSSGGLHIMALKSGKVEDLGPVDKFELSADKSVLLYTAKTDSMGITLTLRHIRSSKIFRLDAISEYKYCPASNTIAAVVMNDEKYSIRLLGIANEKQDILYQGKGYLRGSLAWQSAGKVLAFAEHSPGRVDRLIACDIVQRKTSTLNLDYSSLIAGEISLVPKGLAFSDDGKSLSFYIKPAAMGKQADKEEPEIWNAADKELYPARMSNHGYEYLPKLSLWDLAAGTSVMLTDTASPHIMVTPNYKYALLWNPLDIEPDHKDNRAQQYTLWDIGKNGKQPLLDLPDAWTIYMATSPDGRYVTYFDGRDWMAYEFSSGIHHNLTASLPVRFNTESDGQMTKLPFSSPGWDMKGNFILYDSYDIWMIAPGHPAKKITNGRERGLRYRIIPPPGNDMGRSNHNGARSLTINMDVPILLELGKGASGYAVLMPGGRVSEFCRGKDFFSHGAMSPDGKNLICMRQSYDKPPQLCYSRISCTTSVLFESNRHFREFGLQQAEKVSYATKDGRQLSGMLYYPLTFDKSKRYPVIVHVYENQDWHSNWYVNPSLYNVAGFNRTVFTGEGYFVFMPNITYGQDNPGNDAVACVEAGVHEISLRDDVDSGKIGLIGHSFGGYETNYIIGHSGLFAAAVSGAPINDMTSFYHYVVPGTFKPNFFNSENGQFRMSAPYYQQPQKYVEASPLQSAGAIKVPLLSWTGKEDRQIDQSQTKAFYLALRRTGNEHVMLVYPGEGHIISSGEHQSDLTGRILKWLGHYLKGLPLPGWATPDFDE